MLEVGGVEGSSTLTRDTTLEQTVVLNVIEAEPDLVEISPYVDKIVEAEREPTLFTIEPTFDPSTIKTPDYTIPEVISIPKTIDSYVRKDYLTVNGKDYDVSELSNEEYAIVLALVSVYGNLTKERREAVPFDVFVYQISNITFIKRLLTREEALEPIYESLKIDPESYTFQTKLAWSEFRSQIVGFVQRSRWLIPIFIVLGVVIGSLILYQYTKSFVSAKATKRAMR